MKVKLTLCTPRKHLGCGSILHIVISALDMSALRKAPLTSIEEEPVFLN